MSTHGAGNPWRSRSTGAGDAQFKQTDKYLTSAPELLSVLGSCVTPKSFFVSSSEKRCEASRHNVAGRVFLCASSCGET